MRAIIAKIVTNSDSTGSLTPLNRVGSVNESGISCTNLTLDYYKLNYISNMTI